VTARRTAADLRRRGLRLEWATNACTARALGSEPLNAEAAMTFLDGCLSTSVLAALVLNAAFGWWWTDPIAALLVAAAALNEGIGHWRESAPHTLEAPDS
jgi:divalent metal cation (Fe/Co/Zn/Cd) transporter